MLKKIRQLEHQRDHMSPVDSLPNADKNAEWLHVEQQHNAQVLNPEKESGIFGSKIMEWHPK